jgi:hypothetical protein
LKLTIGGALLDYGAMAAGNLYQEFVAREITPSAPKHVAPNALLILRDGTPVSLILTEDLESRSVENGTPVAFALASDIKVAGVVVARRGCKAFGEVTYAGKSRNDDVAREFEVRIQYLRVGDDQVTLRASKEKGVDTGVGFNRPPVAGGTAGAVEGMKIPAGTALTVYVAGDVALHGAP